MARPIRRLFALTVALPLLGAPLACSGSSGSNGTKSSTGADKSTGKTGGAKPGAGDATITIGDETWKFDSVGCGFGEEGTGVSGAVVNVSATKDRISLYVADDGDDDRYIELADLDDPDEGMNWSTQSLNGDVPDIVVEGKRVTSETTFYSDTGGESLTRDGTVVVNCG